MTFTCAQGGDPLARIPSAPEQWGALQASASRPRGPLFHIKPVPWFTSEEVLIERRPVADTGGMRHVPSWLKVVALISLVAEAAAAAAVFWHAGPRRD